MNNQERIHLVLLQRNDFTEEEKRTLKQIFDTEGRLLVIGLELRSEEKELYKTICRDKTGETNESED